MRVVLLTLVTRITAHFIYRCKRCSLTSESSRQSPLAPLRTHRYHVSFCSVFVFSGLRINNLSSSRCPRTAGWPLWFFFHTLFFRFIPWFIPVPPHLRVCYRGYLIVPPVCRLANTLVDFYPPYECRGGIALASTCSSVDTSHAYNCPLHLSM